MEQTQQFHKLPAELKHTNQIRIFKIKLKNHIFNT